MRIVVLYYTIRWIFSLQNKRCLTSIVINFMPKNLIQKLRVNVVNVWRKILLQTQ